MLPLSFLTTTIVLGILSSKSSAASSDADVQKLCQGQRFGAAVPNPHDCSSFYVCQFVVQLTDCPIGLQYDRRKKVCNWPKDAGCDWVEPDRPNTNDDNYPEGPEVKPPNEPKPDEEQPKTSQEDNDNKPTDDKNPEDGQNSKESAEQSKPGDVTVDDFITEEPDYTTAPPTVDQNNSSEQDQDNQPNHPATDEDVITAEPQTPTPSAEESQDKQTDSPSTDDDMITYTEQPIVDSGESVDPTPGWPKPDRPSSPPSPASTPSLPSNSEETDQQSSEGNQDSNHSQNPPTPPNSEETDKQPSEGDQNSSETPSSTEDGVRPEYPKPPHPDLPTADKPEHPKPPHPDLPTAGNQSSQHWNLIASIVSVETSHTGGFINHPTVGAHSPETGLPVDVMTGYNPKKVQCLHSGLYFLPHPTNCQKYFICAYSHLHLHSCGNGVIWNHKREQCDLGSNSRCYSRDAESEDNSSELVTPFFDDQTQKTTRKVVKPSTRKPVPTKLPATVTATETTTTISQKLPACPANRQIYLPNLDDCHKYFICIMGKPVLTSCPNGLHWDVIGEVCDKPSVARCGRRKKYNLI